MSPNLPLLHRICRFSITTAKLSMSVCSTITERKKNNVEISERFMNKTALWPELLRTEIREKKKELDEMIENNEEWSYIEKRELCIMNLELATIKYDCISGWDLVFNLRKRKRIPRWMEPKTPITLSRINENNDLVRICDGQIKTCDESSIKCSFKEKEKRIRIGGNYIIFPTSTVPVINAFEEIKEDPEILSDSSKELVNLAFGAVQMPSSHDRKMESLPETLNESQVAAVSAVMNSQRNLLCIQGPPGTGKTRVIAECVLKLIEKNEKVIICAPTHAAVTNVYNATIRRMKENGWNEESIERSLLSIAGYEDHLEKHEKYPIMFGKSELINSEDFQKSEHYEKEKAKIEDEVEILKNEIHRDVFGSRLAIFSTVYTSIVSRLYGYHFSGSTVIIDEAGQCTEPATWFPVLSTPHCQKMVLVGDYKQLPAIISSKESKKHKLDVSLMQRLTEEFEGCNVNILLKEQYRMNSKIMNWSNDLFYNSQLSSHESVKNICLSDLYPSLPSDNPINSPTIMINMDQVENRTKEKLDMYSSKRSYINRTEIEMVSKYVNRLVVDVGVDPTHIAVIAPYYAQVEELKKVISVDVKTVNAFQGNERQIIIFCLVRDNEKGNIGFLRDSRRLNVAVTRAKRQFVMIGSAKTMRKNKDMRELLSYFDKEKCIYGEEIFDHFVNVKPLTSN